ncbi:MAG: hypothetical protein ACOC3Z_01665 [Nanoarchaeota archaeon]
MKAKIISNTYYVAMAEDGRLYDVDITNPIIRNAYDNNIEIEGVITIEEGQNRFDNGDYDRSYKIVKKFIPFKEKYIKEDNTIPVMEIKEDKIGDKIKNSKKVHITLPKK